MEGTYGVIGVDAERPTAVRDNLDVGGQFAQALSNLGGRH
jgi:hypothetical protein